MARRRLKGVRIVSRNDRPTHSTSAGRPRRGEEGIEPLDSAENVNWFTSSGNVVKRRGRTTLKAIYEMNSADRIWVEFNKYHQPIKKEAQLLTGFLGLVARNGRYCPINVKDWRKVDERNKKELTDFVMSKFELEDPFHGCLFIRKSVGKKWRDWKHELYCAYGLNKSMNEILSEDTPKEVDANQWKDLVKYWFTDEFKQVENGSSPGRIAFYEITHKKKDGSFMNEEIQELVQRAKNMIAEQSQVGEGSEQETTRLEDTVYTTVFGKDRPGRVRGLGLGPTPSSYYGSSSRSYTHQADVHAVKADLEDMKLRLEEERNDRMQLEARLQEEESKRIQLQDQVAKMMEFMSGVFPRAVFLNTNASTSKK
ncbi:Transposase, Ptta/En/Spm, plant [Corchorus olitorius]|uniref:Transposase, Ptta/En/Spm, plant n=1 Tax=Corchorus olitorius TaxID=93759 RepID=A0A1R3JKV9_9ROSI|nr:Transposase, Ptta/En/Spm, plant [Corchorus olitorius]